MNECSVSGCSRLVRTKGFCNMHHQRWLKHGDPGPPDTKNGKGSLSQFGYKIVKAHGHPLANDQGNAFEHRLVLFSALNGSDTQCHWCGVSLHWFPDDHPGLSPKLVTDHLDGNRLNNSVDNLVPSCIGCNVRRAVLGKPKPKATHCRRGHPFVPSNVKLDGRGRRSCKTCVNMNQRRRYAEKRGEIPGSTDRAVDAIMETIS